MDSKAQSSLEYLLLIAGVVLVAAIVIMLMVTAVNPPTHAKQVFHEKYNILSHVE